MVKDTIKAVKTAENDAAKLTRETAHQKEQMISDAKQNMVSQKNEMEVVLLKAREEALNQATEHNKTVMEQAVAETMKTVTKLKIQAEEKQEEALQIILKELI